MEDAPELFHIGKKIKRLRELKSIKQETLAHELGMTRQGVSKIEQSESVDEELLERIAKALELPVEAIRNFREDALILNIQNMHDNATNFQYNFNPIDKLVQLYDEKVALLERLLESEREKVALLKEEKRSK